MTAARLCPLWTFMLEFVAGILVTDDFLSKVGVDGSPSGEMRRAFLLILPFTSFWLCVIPPRPKFNQGFKIGLYNRAPKWPHREPFWREPQLLLLEYQGALLRSPALTPDVAFDSCLAVDSSGLSFLMPPLWDRLCSTWQAEPRTLTFSRPTHSFIHLLVDWHMCALGKYLFCVCCILGIVQALGLQCWSRIHGARCCSNQGF